MIEGSVDALVGEGYRVAVAEILLLLYGAHHGQLARHNLEAEIATRFTEQLAIAEFLHAHAHHVLSKYGR